MPKNIKRNKLIIELLKAQLNRLLPSITITQFFEECVMQGLGVKDTLAIQPKLAETEPSIFDNDAVLIETLKIIGLMEASKDEKELEKLLEKREKNKETTKEKTDFDKILGALIKVPKPKTDKTEKEPE